MKQIKKTPNIFLYSMNKKDAIGILRNVNDFECDYYFNSASEIKFEIPQKIYDTDKFEWVDNPYYDDVKADMLLYLADPTEQYRFNGSPVLSDSNYSLKSLNDTTPRPSVNMRYDVNGGLNNFKVQQETLLHDLALSKGYVWEWQHYFDSHNKFANNKVDNDTAQYDGYYGYRHMCCDSYIPVENGDIIALRSGVQGSTSFPPGSFIYRAFFYEDDDSATIVRNLLSNEDVNFSSPNPVARIGINNATSVTRRRIVEIIAANNGSITVTDSDGTPYNIGVAEDMHSSGIRGTSSGNTFTATNSEDIVAGTKYYVGYDINVASDLSTGYLRFDLVDTKATRTVQNGTTRWVYHLMPENYVQVYSGLRNITEFNVGDKTSYPIRQVWWVITNTDEKNDGINKTKTITAKSYEYTLSKKTFSLSEGTMPLFYPNKIRDLITSDNWRRDVWESGGSKHETKAKQRCTRGLLNQILDYLPEWKIGYVDSELKSGNQISPICCKYRSFDDKDNENLYSFLLDEVEKAYQCFFIFDSENMTINIVNGNPTSVNSNGAPREEGKVGSASNVVLTWSNAIKNTNIQTTEDKIITALRVHTAEDTYSMGLINPTGNNILYNFSAFKSQMQYVADANKNRTLWEAIEAWQDAYDNSISSYQSAAQIYVDKLLEVIKNESAMADALADYRSIVEKINIGAESQGINNRYLDYPMYYTIINLEVTENYRKTHVKDLYNASKSYYELEQTINDNKNTRDYNYRILQNTSNLLTMNYKTALAHEGYAILSPTEVLELQKFIVEGDWTNENAVFSDDFSAEDILNTLKGVYSEAQNDHNNYISQQCYEFDVTSTNITALDGFANNIDDLTLGRMISLQVDSGDWQFPILMGYHINYSDDSNFSMTFETNYSNKPLKKRFVKIFGAINQSSVKSNSYTFEE